ALKGGLYISVQTKEEYNVLGNHTVDKYEDTLSFQNVVIYRNTLVGPPIYDLLLPATGIPQTGKVALVKLVSEDVKFMSNGRPCEDTHTTHEDLEDVPVATDDNVVIYLQLEKQLSARVWKVYVRASTVVLATEDF